MLHIPSIILLTLTFALAAGIYLLIRAFRKKHTKARFAFAALAVLSSLTTIIITSVLAKETPLQALFVIISPIFGQHYQPRSADPFELVILVVLLWFMHATCTSFFRNWQGPISFEEYRRDVRQETRSLIGEGVEELKRHLRRLPEPEVFVPAARPNAINELKTPEDSLAWNIQARELLSLTNSNLFFDRDSGWDHDALCWHGENERSGDYLLLRCSINDPDEDELAHFVNYAERAASRLELSKDRLSTLNNQLRRKHCLLGHVRADEEARVVLC